MTNSPPPTNNSITVVQFPTEVTVNQPALIRGSFDSSQVAQITVVAEDRFPLNVEIDRTRSTWQVNLPGGFKNPGTRWLRVKGLDASNQTSIDRILSINVRSAGATLTTKQDTIFKLSPTDSSLLTANAKVAVKAGQIFAIDRYGTIDGHVKVYLVTELAPVGKFGYFYAPHVNVKAPIVITVNQDTWFKATTAASNTLNASRKSVVKAGASFLVDAYTSENGHIKVDLTNRLEPVGEIGYFYAPHVKVTKVGEIDPQIDSIPTTGMTLSILTDTLFKSTAANSTDLNDRQKVLLKAGTNYQVTGYAAIDGHFRVTLSSSIDPVGKIGFVYWKHVRLTKQNRAIAFDPEMKSVTVKQDTVFKKRPADSSQLRQDEMAELKTGQVFGVDSYTPTMNHFKVALTESLAPVGDKGFLYVPHVTLKQGNNPIELAPDRKILGVPYFSQRDNPRDPFVTCNVTAIAMVLYYYGVRSKRGGQLEDELYQWIIDRYGASARTDNTVLQQLYRSYGFGGGFGVTRTWAQIKNEIAENRPVVIGGYFTHGGHIITIIGYTSGGYVVNDPYGDGRTGYARTEGRSLTYSYSYMRAMAGNDRDVWAHFIIPK